MGPLSKSELKLRHLNISGNDLNTAPDINNLIQYLTKNGEYLEELVLERKPRGEKEIFLKISQQGYLRNW
jgi:hypothetical protein